jgi:serine phosphatase RsbU (regulator of sigma subunit)
MLSPLLLKDAVELDLEPGDMIGVMTDGVFECTDPDDEEFGEDGVARLLAEHRDAPLDRIVIELHDAVRAHRRGAPPADDTTIVFLRRSPA